MSADIKTHLANDLEQSAAMLDSREFDAVQLDNCASMMRYAATVIRQALAEAEQPAPPECKTEAEKTAYAFGWYKALESVREQPAQQQQEPDPDELTIAYLNGIDTGKKRKHWVGLNASDLAEIPPSCYEGAIWADARLKEKNT